MTMSPREVERKLHKRAEFKAIQEKVAGYDPKAERELLAVQSEIEETYHSHCTSSKERLDHAKHNLEEAKKMG